MLSFNEFKLRVFEVRDGSFTPARTVLYFKPLENEFGGFIIPVIEMEIICTDKEDRYKNDVELSKRLLYGIYKTFYESVNDYPKRIK